MNAYRMRAIGIGVGLLVCGMQIGCANMGMGTHATFRFDDPAWLSPRAQPLATAPERGAIEPEPEVLPYQANRNAAPPPASDPPPRPVEQREPLPESHGPQLRVPSVPDAPLVTLDVRADERRQTGSLATFRLMLRNAGTQPLKDLNIVSEFDEALVFPGRTEKQVAQQIDQLEAGESREIALSLTSQEIGRHCARFAVTRTVSPDESEEDGSPTGPEELAFRTACVDFVARQANITLHGPSLRTAGARAEFTISLSNISDQPIPRATAVVTWSETLSPREATSGAQKNPNEYQWTIDNLQPQETVQIQVEFVCLKSSEEGTVQAALRAGEAAEERVKHDIRIGSPEDGISVWLADVQDLVRVGDEVEYRLVLENRTNRDFENLTCRLQTPPIVTPAAAEWVRSGQTAKLTLPEKGRFMTLPAVNRLAAGDRIEVRVTTRADQAGTGDLVVELSHAGVPIPVTYLEQTTVNPAP